MYDDDDFNAPVNMSAEEWSRARRAYAEGHRQHQQQQRRKEYAGRISLGANKHVDLAIREATEQLFLRENLISRRQCSRDTDTTDIGGHYALRQARTFLAMAGGAMPPMDNKNEFFGRALTQSDLPHLMHNIASAALTKGYEDAPESWPFITYSSQTRDFRPFARSRPPQLDPPEQLGENGEIKGPILFVKEPGGETGQVISYAKNGEVSREVLLNDNLGAVARTFATAGRENARLIGDLVYAKLTGTDTMADGYQLFDGTNHSNVAATSAARSIAEVDAINTRIAAQTGENGQSLNLSCKILLGPPTMRAALSYLVASLNGSGPQDFMAVTDSRLPATVWYGLEDPAIVPAIEVVTLESASSAQRLEMVKAKFDGVYFRYGIDVGIVVTDYKPICRNNGA
jgi:hypothetical protein